MIFGEYKLYDILVWSLNLDEAHEEDGNCGQKYNRENAKKNFFLFPSPLNWTIFLIWNVATNSMKFVLI